MCNICEENDNKNIIKVEVKIKYENPKAYGYPEIVYWDNKYTMKVCPSCGRELKNLK